MSLTAVRPKEMAIRAFDELRPLSVECGGFSRVDGGASFAFGSTKAVASVSGPIEVRLNVELPSRSTLEVNIRPSAGVSATFEKRYSKDIREVLEQVLILSHHPRTLVQVVIQALSAQSPPQWKTARYSDDNSDISAVSNRRISLNPSLIAACVNASSLAFLNASSIPMRGVLCAVAVGKVVGDSPAILSSRTGQPGGGARLFMDPEVEELEGGWAIFAFLFGSTFDGGPKMQGCEVVWADCHGLGSEDEYAKAKELALSGATRIADWEEYPELVAQLLSAMEVNKRWRQGVFAPGEGGLNHKPTKSEQNHRERVLMEIAFALLSRHEVLGPGMRRKPATYAKAIEEKLATYEEKQGPTNALWQARLPAELQHEIAQYAALSETGDLLRRSVGASLRLVNHAWQASVDPSFFRNVIIKNKSHFDPLLGRVGALRITNGPAKYVKKIRLDWFPDLVYGTGQTQIKVEEFHHDISFMREELWDIVSMNPGSTDRLLEVVNRSVPLYKLIMDAEPRTLRITRDVYDRDARIRERSFWRDVVGAHMASLKQMATVRHVIIDSETYLQVLPQVVELWSDSNDWVETLAILRSQNAAAPNGGITHTVFQESHVEEVTITGTSVPVLAILGVMSEGKQIDTINFSGWDVNKEDHPEPWKNFLKAERARSQEAAMESISAGSGKARVRKSTQTGDPDDTDEENHVDPELRLRTVRTAASTIEEGIRTETRRAERRRRKRRKWTTPGLFTKPSKRHAHHTEEDDLPRPTEPVNAPHGSGSRRNVYVNQPLPVEERNPQGDPVVSYVRNKVRTSKYTLLTFLPKNLYQQFQMVSNQYFLILVIIQVFPVFGAAAPQVAMLPLVIIIVATALKDGVEDFRRSQLDDQVNNSAATKLGAWRNVNTPRDPRTRLERFLGIGNAPDKVSKGVKRLREKEAVAGKSIVLVKNEAPVQEPGPASLSGDSTVVGGPRHSLEDIQSVASRHSSIEHAHSYPPQNSSSAAANIQSGIQDAINDDNRLKKTISYSTSSFKSSTRSAGVVDWQRQVSGTARWERTLWKKLDVGDIVLLRDNDQIPADIVVLSTSDADGICYVETKNLDGETNLKVRHSLKATSSIVSEEDMEHSSFILDSEPPHANLYTYNGVLRYRQNLNLDERTKQSGLVETQEKLEPVTINEMLLRGCAVRNTNWIIGLVVFTGADTKIMLNGGATPSKRSKIEKETTFNVVMNFIILIIMTILTGLVNGYYDGKKNTSARYYEINADASSSSAVDAIITAVSCLIAFQNIVPVSLYISIEIVKTIQAYFINQDIDMYYEPYDTCCVPKTWNISDDLGQIEYIFSDKTGTLTQNVMEFQKCSVNGVVYGEGVTEAQRGSAKREGRDDLPSPAEQARLIEAQKEDMMQRMSRAFKNRYLRPEKLTLVSPQLAMDLADRSTPQRSHLVAFFRALAVCHSVLSEKAEPQERPFALDYKAESPDEAALVAAARDVGFPFVNRATNAIDIEVMGQTERHIPLKVLEFNSTRKRMSVVVRNPDGRIILYCKGADSVIYARLAPNHEPNLKAKTAQDMEDFANGGLRTLCVAYRYLTEEEYFNWARVYDAAASAVKDRDEELDKASALIEQDLIILGATALEDKLQEGVPEAIETLHQAGIKLWILTGDKLQTAIEIGFSCNLLKNDMEVMILSADTAEAARIQIEGGLNKIASVIGPPQWEGRLGSPLPPTAKRSFAVVIDGDTLRFALDDSLKELFLNLGTQCDTVVCCRVSPAQKALTVKLVKEGRNAMTLSIGDGANDVAMIQEANIGCGLLGLEGSQAAMSADYAFGQFRFLTKLLIVHGRWSYQRVADMHSNFFYKNVIWTFAMFWYLFSNSWDATYLYPYTFILLYNLAFTSLPIIAMGALDQDVNAKASLAYPQLYRRGILGLEYTRAKFWLYMLDGLYQSVIVYFFSYIVWQKGTTTSWTGKTIDSLTEFGTTASVAAIFCANIFVGLNTSYWTWIMWAVTLGSMAFLIGWIVVYSFINTPNFNDEAWILFSTVQFLATLVLSIVVAIAPRFLYKYVTVTYDPLDKEIVREMWVQGDLKDRLGLDHRRRRGPPTENTSLFRQHRFTNESEMELDSRGRYEAPTVDIPTPAPIEEKGIDATEMTSNITQLPRLAVSHAVYAGPSSPLQTTPDPQRLSNISYYSPTDIGSSGTTTPINPSHPKAVHLDPHIHDRPATGPLTESSNGSATRQSFATADDWADHSRDHSRDNSRAQSRLGTGSSSAGGGVTRDFG
ncbi:hypothetical protein FRB98_000163 [Tulasnella sp. 332]|nr:hypothetical protein FRB98_000163 [Tulasnella sp. 332]